jgi:hypothetical protein
LVYSWPLRKFFAGFAARQDLIMPKVKTVMNNNISIMWMSIVPKLSVFPNSYE